MKKSFLAFVIGSMSLVSPVHASSLLSCALTATVKSIDGLGVLGETVSVIRATGFDSYRYVATLEVTSSEIIRGIGKCPEGLLLIALNAKNQIAVGDDVKVDFSSVTDRPGSSLTYDLR